MRKSPICLCFSTFPCASIRWSAALAQSGQTEETQVDSASEKAGSRRENSNTALADDGDGGDEEGGGVEEDGEEEDPDDPAGASGMGKSSAWWFPCETHTRTHTKKVFFLPDFPTKHFGVSLMVVHVVQLL